jgi:primosomal protein N'
MATVEAKVVRCPRCSQPTTFQDRWQGSQCGFCKWRLADEGRQCVACGVLRPSSERECSECNRLP